VAAVVCTLISGVCASSALAVVGITNARQVAGGDIHACAVIGIGQVKCWGDNSSGQLGDGTSTQRNTPVVVKGITKATQVAAGYAHTCALLAGGSIECWGDNYDGELGDGTTSERKTPVAVEGIRTAIRVATGYYDTCALLAGGSVKCWGANVDGELGDGTDTGPVRCGSDHEPCSPTPVVVKGIARATSITAGALHSCASLADGAVKCWGDNLDGQLGNGTMTNRLTPVAVRGITTAAQVTASAFNSCALLADGHVVCWGANGDGELGDGTPTGPKLCGTDRDPCSPTPVTVIDIDDAKQISAGGDTTEGVDHVCALLAAGTVKCWGYGYDGELADGMTNNTSTPISAQGVTGATQVAAGAFDSCAVFGGGSIKCWGDNSSGELGTGTPTGLRTKPVAVKRITDATSVVVGGYHSCAVLAGRTVACWGDNDNGEIGNGSMAGGDILTEVAVNGIDNATEAGAGDYHSCALLSGGGVQCWGDNSHGELGIGSTNGPSSCDGDPCSPVPVAVSGITTVTQITAGYFQTCALLSAGSIECWGDNQYGQLGDGTTTDSSVPVAVQGVSTATQVAVGEGQTCALLAGGTVECWGNNYYGQLGDGTTTDSSTPVAVQGITDATQITASYDDTCALLAGGTVKCWGYNDDGELGDGTDTGPETCGLYDDACSPTPVAVSGITTATQISAGGNQGCARLINGGLRCWGADYDGELGDGSAGYSLLPVLGRTAVAIPVSGVVSIEPPPGKSVKSRAVGSPPASSAAAKSSGFVRLNATRQIPVGSKVDARSGTIQLVTATGVGRQTQSGVFGGGAFTIRQATSKGQKGLTTLTLLTGTLKGEPNYSVCKAPRATASGVAGADAHAAVSKSVLQTLRASAHGRFRVRGRYSAATVRGTVWDTIDRCDGTLTVVHSGTVLVTDFAKHRTIAVHAGHSYLAKAT